MSRVGKKPVSLPSGVTANVQGQMVSVKGPKGTLSVALHDDVSAKVEGGGVTVDPRFETKRARAMWGTYRALVERAVEGVTKGYERRLEINGVGYRAALQGKTLQLQLGYAHDIAFPIPEGITITLPKPTEIVVIGYRRAEGRPGGGRNPLVPQARALQGQGREVFRRVHLPQGRQEEVMGAADGDRS